MVLAVVVIAPGCTSRAAQEQKTSENVLTQAASIERLDIPGGDAALPPISDSAIDVNSPFRLSLFRNGLALRLTNTMRYAQNTLQSPVPADQQVDVGEHPLLDGVEGAVGDIKLRLARTAILSEGIDSTQDFERPVNRQNPGIGDASEVQRSAD